jgi:hypothetical protein
MNPSKTDFDHIKWKKQFEIASKEKAGFREIRADIFHYINLLLTQMNME